MSGINTRKICPKVTFKDLVENLDSGRVKFPRVKPAGIVKDKYSHLCIRPRPKAAPCHSLRSGLRRPNVATVAINAVRVEDNSPIPSSAVTPSDWKLVGTKSTRGLRPQSRRKLRGY